MTRLLLMLLLVTAGTARAQSTHVLIASGVGGEPRIAQRLQRDAMMLQKALSERFNAKVTLLSESSTPRSDKAGITRALQTAAAATKRGDRMVVILLGHGSAQGGEARFNIPGPDLTATELSQALTPFAGRELVVVLATSASGAFIPVLEAAGRIIVTATRSGAESEEVVFAEYFAKALAEDVADANKDKGVSIAEAVEYARREVERFYQQQNRLVTEHAVLTGSGAEAFVLRSGRAQGSDPVVQELYRERAELEQRVAALRARKAEMTAVAYDAALERLLLELARKTQQIRTAEGEP